MHSADEVLVNTEDMAVVASELRAKIKAKISAWAGVSEPSEQQERKVPLKAGVSCSCRC